MMTFTVILENKHLKVHVALLVLCLCLDTSIKRHQLSLLSSQAWLAYLVDWWEILEMFLSSLCIWH